MAKNKGGRPTVMTENVLNKLEEAFSWGCTDVEASLFAGIDPRTLYTYCEKHPEFSQRKETLKKNPALKARRVLFGDIEKGDSATAKYVLDKADGKAKQAHEISGKGGGEIKTGITVRFVESGEDG